MKVKELLSKGHIQVRASDTAPGLWRDVSHRVDAYAESSHTPHPLDGDPHLMLARTASGEGRTPTSGERWPELSWVVSHWWPGQEPQEALCPQGQHWLPEQRLQPC
jgi:hypothetical protein